MPRFIARAAFPVALLAWLIPLAAPAQPGEVDATVALEASGRAAVGKEAPWFSGWTADNRVINRTRLAKAPGTKAVAMVFFATWCVNCKQGLKAVAAQAERLKEAGVTLALVDYREDARDVVPWLKDLGVNAEFVVYDKFGEIARAFGAARSKPGNGDAEDAALPLTVVFDPSGAVRAIFAQEGPDYVERLLAAALHPVTPAPSATSK
jgi:peroxiredoxin